MVNKATGEIQNIKKDLKGLQINNDWYSSFKPLKDLKKGDYIELEFEVKGNFKNIKSYKLSEPSWSKEINSNYKEPVKSKYTSDTTINCLVMQSIQHSLNKGYALDKATFEVVNSYKYIIDNI